MSYFKNSKNVYWLDNDADINFLPDDVEKISEEEALKLAEEINRAWVESNLSVK